MKPNHLLICTFFLTPDSTKSSSSFPGHSIQYKRKKSCYSSFTDVYRSLNTFQKADSARQYVEDDCTLGTQTRCGMCRPGEFMSYAHGYSSCFRCGSCDEEMNLVEVAACTTVKDTQCVCKDGYNCTAVSGNERCEMCEQSSLCPPGEGKSPSGGQDGAIGQTHCQKCPERFFSKESSHDPCQPWTSCEDVGLAEIQKGSPTSDSECGLWPHKRWALIFLPILVVAIATVGIASRWRQRTRCKAEDNPGYHEDHVL
nr:PREDICTED: tumor necrosis factor receptor superfamily member 5-like [Latimeria chalumnae]|eukprot:XP_014349220.1 PREDICTED: tumor necrosis factor receptor superfamily member 5-like [Latimeria chalumnae]